MRISDWSSDVCSSDLPKAPPYSLEAEQSVLGGLMLENRHWDDLADKLGADDFYREDHQMIYRAIAELASGRRPCDFITLSEHLKARGQLEDRSEEPTSELQSLMRISYAVFSLQTTNTIL